MMMFLGLVKAADDCESDGMSALQMVRGINHAQEDKRCVSVSVGQTAPIAGIFNSNDGLVSDHHVVRGEKALKAGEFCIDQATVALLQRSFSFSEESQVEQVVAGKTTTEVATTAEATTTEATEAIVKGKKAKKTTTTTPTTTTTTSHYH